jgi:hypothetical protein
MALEKKKVSEESNLQEEQVTQTAPVVTVEAKTEQVVDMEKQLLLQQLEQQNKDIQELKQMFAQVASQKSAAAAPSSSAADIAFAVTQALKQKTDSEKFGIDGANYINEEEIDPNDLLEQGVPFFCHSGGYIIVDDKRKGFNVATPYRRPIIFTHYQTSKTGSGKDLKTETLSRYVSNSKKEVEWLRASSFYGWKIFDDFMTAKSTHAKYANGIQRNLNSARAMQTTELIAACTALGVMATSDLENMRLQYAQIMAEKEMAQEEEGLLLKSKEASLHKHLIESGNVAQLM